MTVSPSLAFRGSISACMSVVAALSGARPWPKPNNAHPQASRNGSGVVRTRAADYACAHAARMAARIVGAPCLGNEMPAVARGRAAKCSPFAA